MRADTHTHNVALDDLMIGNIVMFLNSHVSLKKICLFTRTTTIVQVVDIFQITALLLGWEKAFNWTIPRWWQLKYVLFSPLGRWSNLSIFELRIFFNRFGEKPPARYKMFHNRWGFPQATNNHQLFHPGLGGEISQAMARRCRFGPPGPVALWGKREMSRKMTGKSEGWWSIHQFGQPKNTHRTHLKKEW